MTDRNIFTHFHREKKYFQELFHKKLYCDFWTGLMRGARSHQNFEIFLISEQEIMKSTQCITFF